MTGPALGALGIALEHASHAERADGVCDRCRVALLCGAMIFLGALSAEHNRQRRQRDCVETVQAVPGVRFVVRNKIILGTLTLDCSRAAGRGRVPAAGVCERHPAGG